MTNFSDPSTMIGKHAVDSDGDKIGTIEQVYLNDASGQPEWVTVKTGLFGRKESFAPLQGATDRGDDVQLAVSKDVVKGAPNVDSDGHTERGRAEGAVGLLRRPARLEHPVRDQRRDSRRTRSSTRRSRGPRWPDRHPGPRHLRQDHRRRDDPLRGAPAGRNAAGRGRPGEAAQVRRHRRRSPRRCRCATKRSASSGNRSPTPTSATPCPAATSPRRSTKSRCTPNGPSCRRRPSRWSGSAWPPRRSPRTTRSPRPLRKEQIDDVDVDSANR